MKYAILWRPPREQFEPRWVLDEAYSVALYGTERSAKADIKLFVHPDEYEPVAYNARARRTWT